MSNEAILNAHAHTHTHKHSDYPKPNLHSLKLGSKQKLEMDEDSCVEQKTWRVYSFLGEEKKEVFRIHFSPEKVSVREEGEYHSM